MGGLPNELNPTPPPPSPNRLITIHNAANRQTVDAADRSEEAAYSRGDL